MANELAALSNELAAVVERTGKSVVAVHARPRFASSGVFWRPGIIVTAEHTIRREEEITVTLPDGKNAPATLAGSDLPAALSLLTERPLGSLLVDRVVRLGDVTKQGFEPLVEGRARGKLLVDPRRG